MATIFIHIKTYIMYIVMVSCRVSGVYLGSIKFAIYIIHHRVQDSLFTERAVAIVIMWWLDVQLPVQSVPITTKRFEFQPRSWWGVLDTALCAKVCQFLAANLWFSPGN